MPVAAFVAVAGLFASAYANIYTTLPISSTICVGGQTCTLRWQENNVAPLISGYGQTLVDLWSGTDTSQTFVYSLGIVNPANVSTYSAVIPPNVAPNGQYFIRYSSISARDSAGNPLLAFSTRFALTGMTGTVVATSTQDPVLLTATPLIGVPPASSVVPSTSSLAPPSSMAPTTSKAPTSAVVALAAPTTTTKSGAESSDKVAQSVVVLAVAAAAMALQF